MTFKLRNRIILGFIVLLFACATALYFDAKIVKATENHIDYVNQEYKLFDEEIMENLTIDERFNMHNGLDYRYVFRIDCPDLSSNYPELSELDLVKNKYIYIYTGGCYIWFQNGEVKYSNDRELNYIDIEVLYYDSAKNQIYVMFDFGDELAGSSIDSYLVQNDREQGSMYYIEEMPLGFNPARQEYNPLCEKEGTTYLDYEITQENRFYFDETISDNFFLRQQSFPIVTESDVISKYQNKTIPYIDIFGTIYVLRDNYCFLIKDDQVTKKNLNEEKLKYIKYYSGAAYGSVATYFMLTIPTNEFDLYSDLGVKFGGVSNSSYFEYVKGQDIIYDDYVLQDGDIIFGEVELFNNGSTQNYINLSSHSVKISCRNESLQSFFNTVDFELCTIINGVETQLEKVRGQNYYTFSAQDFDIIQLKGIVDEGIIGGPFTFYSQSFMLVDLYKNMVDSDFTLGVGPELNDQQKAIITMKVNAYENALNTQVDLSQDSFIDVDVLNPEQYVGGNFLFRIPKNIDNSMFLLHYSAGSNVYFKVSYTAGEYLKNSSAFKFTWNNGGLGYSLDGTGGSDRELIQEIVSSFDMYEDENYIYIKAGGTYEIITFLMKNASGDFCFYMSHSLTDATNCHVQVVKNVIPNDDVLIEIKDLQTQIIELRAQISNLNTTNQTQQQEILNLEESLSDLEMAYNEQLVRYQRLNDNYLYVLSENETLRIEKSQIIEEKLAEISAHNATKIKFEAQIAEKNANIEELTVQLSEVNATKIKLEAQIAEKNVNIKDLTAQLSEVNATLTEKEKKLITLQQEYALLEDQYEELDAEYQAFLEGVSGNEEAIAKLLHDYKMQVARLEKEVEDLTEENERLESELDKDNGLPKGCQLSGCSIGGGSSGGIIGSDSSLLTVGFGLTAFGVVLYVKRKKIKE